MIKIKNLKTTASQLKEDMELSSVLGKRNKLLVSSDWTQLSDVNLTEECKASWRVWRSEVRKIDITDKKAMGALVSLEQNQPQKVYKSVEIISDKLEDLKLAALIFCKDIYNTTLQTFNFSIVDEAKYKEGIGYLSEEHANIDEKTALAIYPLLRTHVILTGNSLEEVAKSFIDIKKVWMTQVLSLESIYFEKTNQIKNAKNKEDIETTKKQMVDSAWILTLT